MAYGRKYYTTYKRRSGGTTTIDILEDGYSGASTELKPNVNPLIISQSGDVNNIYTPTIGSGAQINLLVTPLTLSTLYTSDPQKYMVKVYNGASGSNIIWQGFIDASIYHEDYSVGGSLLTPITLNCNDGMKILDNMWYKSNGVAYSGTSTIGEVINTIIGKLGTTFNNVYTSNDITYYNGSGTNLFNLLKLNNLNFIDESDISMTCREVLDSVIGGLGLIMFFRAEDIYIIDPINLHTTSKGRKFVLPDFTESTESLGGYIDISGTTLSFFDSNQVFDIIPAVNEVQVSYDPYTTTDISFDFNNSDNWDDAGSWSDQTTYFINYGVEYKGWTEGSGNQFVAVKKDEFDTPVYMLYINNNDTPITWETGKSLYPDDNLNLKISCEAYFNTKEEVPNIYSEEEGFSAWQFYISFAIKIGDRWYKDEVWEEGETGSYKRPMSVKDWGVADYHTSTINDTWATGKQIIPLYNGLSGGTVTVYIYDKWTTTFPYSYTSENNTPPKNILIKNLKLELVDPDSGNVIDNSGVLFRGNLSTDIVYKTNPIKLNTTNGTGTYGVSKAAYLSTDNFLIDGLYRSGDGTIRNTAKLILQSYISQYKQPRYKLSAVLDVSEYLLSFNLYLFCDNTYLPGRSFFICSYTYNDRDETMQCEMVEITSSRETF